MREGVVFRTKRILIVRGERLVIGFDHAFDTADFVHRFADGRTFGRAGLFNRSCNQKGRVIGIGNAGRRGHVGKGFDLRELFLKFDEHRICRIGKQIGLDEVDLLARLARQFGEAATGRTPMR